MADLVITPANVKPGATANPARGLSTGAVTAGDVVCILTDGTIDLADANGGAPKDVPVGIAACSAAGAGQYVMYVSLDGDFLIGATTASGVAYFLSGNPGKICLEGDLSAGMKASLIGFGKTGNKIAVNIVASGQTI